jgi:regulator of replication initiation timing
MSLHGFVFDIVNQRRELARTKANLADAMRLLDLYGKTGQAALDLVDDQQEQIRARDYVIGALKVQVRQEPYPEYERLTSENERLRARLAAYVGAGRVVEGLPVVDRADSRIEDSEGIVGEG